MVYIKFNNSIYFINHGGIPVLPKLDIASIEYVSGVGKYGDEMKIAEIWNDTTPDNYYQIFGHRNIYSLEPKQGRCYLINGDAERGDDGKLVALNISNEIKVIIQKSFRLRNAEYDEWFHNRINTKKIDD